MKVRFVLKSFDQDLIEDALENISYMVSSIDDCQIAHVISLPSRLKRFCVLRSPHIDKDSREHFEVELHKTFIDVIVQDPINLNLLLKASVPAGISCFFEIIST